MLKVYGFPISTWANRVRFTANKLGLDYEYVTIDLTKGESQTEAYLAISPAGKVPAMDDDGFVLFESGAIVNYLANKAHSELYPQALEQRALIDQWSDFTCGQVAMPMGKVLFNSVIYKFIGAEKDDNSLAEGLALLDQYLPIIDAQLGKVSYLASDQLSLADMVLLAWLDPAELCEVDLSAYGNISRWRSQLKQEDFYTDCHNNYQDMF